MVHLARCFLPHDLTEFAEGYLEMSPVEVGTIKFKYKDEDANGFIREVLNAWRMKCNKTREVRVQRMGRCLGIRGPEKM